MLAEQSKADEVSRAKEEADSTEIAPPSELRQVVKELLEIVRPQIPQERQRAPPGDRADAAWHRANVQPRKVALSVRDCLVVKSCADKRAEVAHATKREGSRHISIWPVG
jgi:hypothetical protein